MAVASKPSATAPSTSSQTFAALPNFTPQFAANPGGSDTDNLYQQWWNQVSLQLLQLQNTNQQGIATATATSQASTGTLQAQINHEEIVRADADTALATSITTVSASLTTDINNVAASVVTESTARATADGNLSGKYTLTVTAGNVVTGMNITSSSGGGTNISNVVFQAGSFQIWDGSSTAYPVFNATGGVVTLASTLVVTSNGKVYIGTGTFANSNTPWYVDSSGNFSLGAKLTWDTSTLAVAGTIVSANGYFGSTSNAVSIGTGGLSVGNTGAISGGQTAYNTGTGFWMGYQSGTYAFSIGNPAANYLTWNGTNVLMLGGSSPNEVVIDTNGFTVGVPGARCVTLGTQGGNACSLNFRNSSGTSLMGIYLNGNTVASFQQALGSNGVNIFTGTGAGSSVVTIAAGSGFANALLNLSDSGGTLQWLTAAGGGLDIQTGAGDSVLLTTVAGALAISDGIQVNGQTNLNGFTEILGQSSNEVLRIQGRTDSSNNRTFFTLFSTNPGFWWEISQEDGAGAGSSNGLSFNERSGGAAVRRFYIESGGTPRIGNWTSAPGTAVGGFFTWKDSAGTVHNVLTS